MIFKGTDKLSECDINLISYKLSGYINAFTSYDYTGYLFDFPSQHWQEALPIMADCMVNCTFKEEFLHSELKAVIQELKMYKDEYVSGVCEALVSAIFADHPYHHPIIGYKHDLWSLSRDALVRFYRKHYIPNNATLIVVGDVQIDEVIALAKKEFGTIPADSNYKKEHYYHAPDLLTQTVTLYRDVKIPHVVLAWVVPGASTGNDYLVDIVAWLLASGRGSRLYKKLVNELQLVTDIDAFSYDLFDHQVFFLYVQPKDATVIEKIIETITNELQKLAQEVVPQQELTRAIKKAEVEHLQLMESYQKQAYEIGKFFLAVGDEQYLYTFTDAPKDHLGFQVKEFINAYLRPALMHRGSVVPLPAGEQEYWLELQDISDQEDARVLAGRERKEHIEIGKCVSTITAKPPKPFAFPRAQILHLDNGLKVLSCVREALPKIDIVIDFEAKYQYDPVGKEGLSTFVAHMLLEGTKSYTAEELINTIESNGMTLQTVSGMVALSMLAEDLPKGLELLNEILTNALFSADAIEKVRAQMLADLNEFWDTPMQFSNQIARQEIYKDHPYSKNPQGTMEGVKNITRDDLEWFYRTYLSPRGARLALVGDIGRYNVQKLLGDKLDSWQGPEVKPLQYPPIEPIKKHALKYPILRDQTVLCFAGLSVKRTDPDFDALLIFEQVFGGGVLNSMASRLFDLREQTGLFYTISGSLVARVDKQNGLILIRTIVSNDRIDEAEAAISRVIDTAINTLTDDEMSEAQQAIINSLVDNFASNYQTALTLLFKDAFNLPEDYYDKRAAQLRALTKEEVQRVVRKYLTTDSLITIRIGRV